MKTLRLLRIVKYWLKILHSPDTRNIVKIYKVLCQDVEKGKTNWAFNVKTLLYQLGFGQVWLFQTVGSLNAFLSEFKQRLFDGYIQTTQASLERYHERQVICIHQFTFCLS